LASGCHFQQVPDEIRKGPAFRVRTLLQSLVELHWAVKVSLTGLRRIRSIGAAIDDGVLCRP
jgi:hypothetical protein